ncbi:MAG TPA: A/G-specific adenine glycosylase [Fibrobacteria bacterium]|nr:A/G-specific adenine glycosylase [Fibrobacteria bacterium]
MRAAVAEPSAPVAEPARALADWFAANRRDLPWRRELADPDAGTVLREPSDGDPRPRRDPYGTWISEIMLQQTQVATVVDYYRRWMLRFPDVAALAGAEERDVLEAWAGLGYYSRARNVLATARKVMEEHGGRFPWRREDLLGLKGVGEYTAGAIASLAFNRPEPILDGNLVRVFSRLYGLDFLPDGKEGKRAYWDLARAWAGAHDAALVNEGLMELGALICTPRNPDCARCPLARHCAACGTGGQESFPPARSRKEPVDVAGFAVAAFRAHGKGDEVLLYTPRKPERLAGLATFPVFPVADLPALREAWRAAVPGLPKAALRPRAVTITHSITHHRYRLRIVEARLEAGAPDRKLPEGYAWSPIEEVDRMLVSSLPKKIWKAVARSG